MRRKVFYSSNCFPQIPVELMASYAEVGDGRPGQVGVTSAIQVATFADVTFLCSARLPFDGRQDGIPFDIFALARTARAQWSRGIFGFFETCAGCKAFIMGCNWPCCGPCLYAKISARVTWPKTQFETFGDTPFKQVYASCFFRWACSSATLPKPKDRKNDWAWETIQWFRISLLLVCIYWLSSWGEGVSAPTPRFNVIDQSQADLKVFEKMGKPRLSYCV